MLRGPLWMSSLAALGLLVWAIPCLSADVPPSSLLRKIYAMDSSIAPGKGNRIVMDGKALPNPEVKVEGSSLLLVLKGVRPAPGLSVPTFPALEHGWLEELPEGLSLNLYLRGTIERKAIRRNPEGSRVVVDFVLGKEAAAAQSGAPGARASVRPGPRGLLRSVSVLPRDKDVLLVLEGSELPRPDVRRVEGGTAWEINLRGTSSWGGPWSQNLSAAGLEVYLWKEDRADSVALNVSQAERTRLELLSNSKTKVVLRLSRSAGGADPSGPIDPAYLTVPVTFDFRGVDLRDAFRLMGKVMNLDVICDPSVQGSVTFSVQGAPFNQVFAMLMRMFDLSYRVLGRTLYVADRTRIGKVLEGEERRAYRVDYADLEKVASILKEELELPRVQVDSRLNTIWVSASPSKHVEVAKLLGELDKPARQVMLRAEILELSESGARELASAIEAIYDYWWSFSFKGADGTTSVVYDKYPGGQIELPSVRNKLRVAIDAVVKEGKGKVLAKPSVIALDGEKALVNLTQNVKYISARDEAGNPTYSEEKVGPRLEFTPRIGRDGFVTLSVKVSTGDIVGYLTGAQREQIPLTTERSAETKVRVMDGQPLVIGGLSREFTNVSSYKVPLLGDIPFIGTLFRGQFKTAERNEVVIVLVPFII